MKSLFVRRSLAGLGFMFLPYSETLPSSPWHLTQYFLNILSPFFSSARAPLNAPNRREKARTKRKYFFNASPPDFIPPRPASTSSGLAKDRPRILYWRIIRL